MDAALFCISNLAILWLAAHVVGDTATRRLDFVVGVAASFPIWASLMILMNLLGGGLDAGICAFLTLLVTISVTRQTDSHKLTSLIQEVRLARSPAEWIAISLLVAFASIPVVRVVTAGTGYFIDDFGYHAVAVASWVHHGDFRQFMPQFMAYLPLNAELLAAWFALSFQNDTMVVLASLSWLILAAVAAGGLVRLSGGDAAASLFTAVAVVASPPIVWQTRTFTGADLAGAACLLGAAYFAVAAVRDGKGRHADLAALLAGFAAGTKATFLPVAALICLFPLCTGGPSRERVLLTVRLSLWAAALGSVWYVKNWIATGNPLFPAALGPFEGPLTRAEQVDIKLTGLLAQVPWTPRLWGHMIYDYLDWPLPLGLLALAGYVRAALTEVPRFAGMSSEDSHLRRLLLICGVSQFVLHLFAPFCLGGGYVDGRILVYSRYIMPWFLFGLVLAGPLLDSRSRAAWGWQTLLLVGLAMCWPGSGFMRIGAGVLMLAIALLLYFVPRLNLRPILCVAAIAIWPALAFLAPKMRAASEHNIREHLRTAAGESMGPALAALDDLSPGSRITRFANHAYFNSPIYGRDWHLQPVFTGPDGRALAPLHEQFRGDPMLTFFSKSDDPLPEPGEFIANLKSADISYVFITKYDTSEWPPQHSLLQQSGATLIYSDQGSELWGLD